MISGRILSTASLFATAAAWGQLPPSVLQPGRPVAPLAPTAETVAAPAAVPASAKSNTLSPEEIAQGWRLLFDGQRLLGLRGVQQKDPLSAGWVIGPGELVLKEGKQLRTTGGDLITTDVFWDFDFRFEWKTTASADSGIRYLLLESGSQTPAGLEYQIIDDVHNSISLKAGPLRRSGSLDNVIAVGNNAKLRVADPLNKVGDPWNEGRIVVQGNHVEHWMNGEKVLAFELGPQLKRLAEANKMKVFAFFGIKNRTRICIVDQGTEVAFRNLKIRPLLPQATATPVPAKRNIPNPLLLPGKPAPATGQ